MVGTVTLTAAGIAGGAWAVRWAVLHGPGRVDLQGIATAAAQNIEATVYWLAVVILTALVLGGGMVWACMFDRHADELFELADEVDELRGELDELRSGAGAR